MNLYRGTLDTRMVWYDLCNHYQHSLSSKIRSQELLRYAHTANLSQSNHCGTYQAWITNLVETLCQYQVLQTDENKLSDQMMIDFLNSLLRGTPLLEGVLDT